MEEQVYHMHHIVPKHMGGSDDPSNLIKLTVEEHAEAHRKLYEDHGNKYDYIAYMALSKQIGFEEATYMKLLGPKNWTKEGKEKLRKLAKQRTGKKNGFYGKKHTEETNQKNREAHSGENNWITGIDPAELPYTKQYTIHYTDGTKKTVNGLKVIAEEFNVSIANTHNTIKRMKEGKIPSRGVFSGILIEEV
jgi:hypothetical protein